MSKVYLERITMPDSVVAEALKHLRDVCKDNLPKTGFEWDFLALDIAIHKFEEIE